ncbi:MAG: hypothetical protein ACRDS0_03790 [Pseudonocardiaceae bacterium]
MTSHSTNKKTHAAGTSVGPVGRWLADLGLGYVLMLAANIGGLVWLVMIYPLGMRHGPAVMLSIGAGLLTFGQMCLYRADHITAARREAGADRRRH